MAFDDVLDLLVLEDHFLMVAMTLCRSSGFNGVAHHNIDFYFFSLFWGEAEKLSVGLQKIDVFLLFGLAP